MHVCVGLDQSELGLFATGKLGACGSITVVSDFELTGVDSHYGTDEERLHGDRWVGHSFQEHPAVFQIIHVDTVISWIESEQIIPDQVRLLVVPVDIENVAFFLDLLHFSF